MMAALALSVVAIGYNYQRAEKFQAEAKFQESRARAYQEKSHVLLVSMRDKDATIAKYQAATKELVKIAHEQADRATEAAEQIDKLKKSLTDLRAFLRVQEDADHAIPNCEKLLRSDLNVCPGHTLGMRERARRSLQRSGSANPGARPAETGPSIGS
jgi:DNA repair exonuclease SbcCD ATPase subunit